jgi:GGDEF domain-containing protein
VSEERSTLDVDSRERTLERVVRDTLSFQRGLRSAMSLAVNREVFPVGAFYVDLDRSADVRKHGLGYKIELVRQARGRIAGVLADSCVDAVVVDAGTRDETFVVMPGLGLDEARRIAESVWEAVRSTPFSLRGLSSPCAVTVSIGVAVAFSPQDLPHLLETTREAQVVAKATRDTVKTGAMSDRGRRTLSVPGPVVDLVGRCGIGWDEAVARGLEILEEARGPVWYWVVERAKGNSPPLDLGAIDWDGVPHPHRDLYCYLIASTAFEGQVPHVGRLPGDLGSPVGVLVFPTGEAIADNTATRSFEGLLAARLGALGATGRTHRAPSSQHAVMWTRVREDRLAALCTSIGCPEAQVLTAAVLMSVDESVLVGRDAGHVGDRPVGSSQ